MDDELKAIQDDLDSVLSRLAGYMSSDKLTTEFVEWGEATREDAANAIFSYAGAHSTTSPPQDLSSVICLFRLSRAYSGSRENTFIDNHGEDAGSMVTAIAALRESDALPQSDQLSLLRSAAHSFMEGEAKWFGQGQGLPLVRPRKTGEQEAPRPPLVTDGYIDKLRHPRLMAAMDVYFANRDLSKSIDDGLFEEIGDLHAIKPGTLKAIYYSDEAKRLRHAHELVEDITGQKIGRLRGE